MSLTGRTAIELAAAVHAGEASATDVVAAHLDRIERYDGRIGAFVLVRREAALSEAAALDGRDDLDRLPLAGVPVAIKDNIDVAGEPTRYGSRAATSRPAEKDDPTVAGLRAAGAVVVGKTRMPELGLWANSSDDTGMAVSPWDTRYSAGGSSGGSGAAVAAGMVPIALGNDGLGSIRIPAACNGLFGIKPASGLVPHGEEEDWFGMTQHGPLTTSVADAALMLDVLAGTDRFRDLAAPATPLRVAVSVKSLSPTVRVGKPQVEAALEAGRLLRTAGHHVFRADPPFKWRDVVPATKRLLQASLEDLELLGVPEDALQGRTRTNVRLGRWVRRISPVRPAGTDGLKRRMHEYFADVDVLVTPTLPGEPPAAGPWHERSWLANYNDGFERALFTGPFNLADLAAASIPVGHGGNLSGLPVSVQLSGGEDAELRLLQLARQLEELNPWERTAPLS